MCKCVQDEKLFSHDNPSFFSIAVAAVYPFLSPSSHFSPASKTNHMCVYVTSGFFFILLQVHFFILFRSRTRHNIKRTHFSYHHHTILCMYASSYPILCASPRHTRCNPTISDVFLIHDFIFRAAACCIYKYIIIIIKMTIGWRWVTAVEHGTVDRILFSFCTCALNMSHIRNCIKQYIDILYMHIHV